jgi:hypothetical protein
MVVAATEAASVQSVASFFDNTEAFFAHLRAQRREDGCRHQDIATREIVNPNTTWSDDDARWDDVWTDTTSDDE